MKNKALNAFYEKLLTDVGIVDGGDGLLSYIREDNDKVAITLEGRRLALPTRDNLKLPSGDVTIFHPASEQLMSGPSPVLDALREYIMLRLSTAARHLTMDAMSVAKDTALQKKVRGSANKLLSSLTEADAKMVDTLDKVLDNVGMSPENRMYNIFLVSAGSKATPRGLRTAKVSFPMMDDAYSGDNTTFFGVKMPRKTRDKPAIVGMFDTLLGTEEDAENENIFEYTSELRQAPYFHSLLLAFKGIAEHQNELIEGLEKAAPGLKAYKYNLDWLEELEDFENFVKKVGHAAPLLPGNQGTKVAKDDDDEDTEEEVKAKGTSWRDLRDAISEDDEEDYRGRRGRRDDDDVEPVSGWRARLKPSRERERDSGGISFGRDSRRSRRGGFDEMAEPRRDSRDRDYDRRGRRSGSAQSWRDIRGY